MAPPTRRIAVLRGYNSDRIQALLASTATDLESREIRIAGLTSRAYPLPDRTCSAGTLYDINSGDPFSIYLDTPPEGTSCHLDAAGVNAACTSIIEQIADCDLVILSKFGKLEAMQKGLFPAFEAAIAAGKPILTTVSERHRPTWDHYAPDAVTIRANRDAISDWWAGESATWPR